MHMCIYIYITYRCIVDAVGKNKSHTRLELLDTSTVIGPRDKGRQNQHVTFTSHY